MRKYNTVMAIIFIVINFLPFIFGVCFFFLIIPIPGIVLYFFYWRILKQQTSILEIRNTWIATAIYNLLLMAIFSSKDGAELLEIQMPEQAWMLAYQAAAFAAGSIMAYMNQNYLQESKSLANIILENEEDTEVIQNI